MDDFDQNPQQYWEQMHQYLLDEMQAQGKEKIVVSVLIVANGKALLVRRSSEEGKTAEESKEGYWEFPGGGVELDDSETIIDAAIREAKEEANVVLKGYPTDRELHVHPTGKGIRIILRYDVDPSALNNVVLSDEHDDQKIIGPDEFDNCQPMMSETREALKELSI